MKLRMYSRIKIAVFLILSLSWLIFAYYVGRLIPDKSLPFALLATFLFGLPLYLATTYAVTIQKIHNSAQFSNKGILYWFSSRRILPYIWWALWSVAFSYLLLFYLGAASALEWIAFLITLPVFAIIHTISLPIIAREYKPYIAANKSLVLTRRVTTCLMAIFYVLLVKLTGENQQYVTLEDAIQKIEGASNSILILETARLLSFVEGLKAFALQNLDSLNNILYLAFLFIGSIFLFYNISLALSSFMIPASEYRRVLVPIQDIDQPPRISPKSLAITSALVTFFVFFIYYPTTIYFDEKLRSNPRIIERIVIAKKYTIKTVDMIGIDLFNKGTIDQIKQTRLDFVSKLDSPRNELIEALDLGFQRMAENVDSYLNWYYSLYAEYDRIGAMAIGELEKTMKKKLKEHLEKDNPFDQAQRFFDEAFQQDEQLSAEFAERVNKILAKNRFQPDASHQLDIAQQSTLDSLLELPSLSIIVKTDDRLLISGGTFVVTGVIAGKVTAKAAGKGVIKLGAKALAKVMTSKTVSAFGGAAIGFVSGATMGSVIPGIGTGIGAIVGGILGGLSLGVGVDYLLLKLEETLSRDDFKHQILETIKESQIELKNSLLSEH